MGQGSLFGSEAKGHGTVHVHQVKFSHVTKQGSHILYAYWEWFLTGDKSEAVPGHYLGKCLLGRAI